MAADSYLLEQADQPTLRLYAWERPCLSLGYAQRWTGTAPAGVEIVRRPSGGRAVLHDQEITYAIALPEFHGSLQQVYSELTGLWLEALQKLDPNISQSQQKRRSYANPSCYQLTQMGEICRAGEKLIGSAQVRRGQRLLQHGSIPLGVNSQLYGQIFPGARLPACLGPLCWQQLVGVFPRILERRDWQDIETRAIEALQRRPQEPQH